MAKTIRVYKDGQVWVAKKDGTTKASAIKNTQKEAYLAARSIALNQGLTITVYYPTGGIKTVINPRQKGGDGDCFITTSCVKYFGLEDDCYELQTLRRFRDNYLLHSNGGRNLIRQYYLIAPFIVKKMEGDKNKDGLFKKVFLEIEKACQAIERSRAKEAVSIYKNTVLYLMHYLNIK